MKKKKSNNQRKLWTGFYVRKTKTKREKELSIQNKYKKDMEEER